MRSLHPWVLAAALLFANPVEAYRYEIGLRTVAPDTPSNVSQDVYAGAARWYLSDAASGPAGPWSEFAFLNPRNHITLTTDHQSTETKFFAVLPPIVGGTREFQQRTRARNHRASYRHHFGRGFVGVTGGVERINGSGLSDQRHRGWLSGLEAGLYLNERTTFSGYFQRRETHADRGQLREEQRVNTASIRIKHVGERFGAATEVRSERLELLIESQPFFTGVVGQNGSPLTRSVRFRPKFDTLSASASGSAYFGERLSATALIEHTDVEAQQLWRYRASARWFPWKSVAVGAYAEHLHTEGPAMNSETFGVDLLFRF